MELVLERNHNSETNRRHYSVVFSKKLGENQAFLFRSYPVPANKLKGFFPPHQKLGDRDSSDATIIEAARATSAAPRYLKPMKIGEDQFRDGAFICNDPSEELLKDVKLNEGISSDEKGLLKGSVFLTLGTGLKRTEAASGVVGRKRLQNLRSVLSEIEGVIFHREQIIQRMREKASDDGFRYILWDGGERVGQFKLDDCTKFDDMEREIEIYVASHQEELLEVAESLVKERRRRMKEDPDRWHRFAHCTIMRCPDFHCEGPKWLNTATDLRQHIEESHPGRWTNPEEEIENVKKRRTEPLAWGPWCVEELEELEKPEK